MTKDATAYEVEDLEARITQILAIQRVYELPIERQLPLLEQKRLVHAEIHAAVNRQPGGVSLIREEVSLSDLVSNLAVETRHRLAASVAPGAAEVPRFVEAIAAVDIYGVALICVADKGQTRSASR